MVFAAIVLIATVLLATLREHIATATVAPTGIRVEWLDTTGQVIWEAEYLDSDLLPIIG